MLMLRLAVLLIAVVPVSACSESFDNEKKEIINKDERNRNVQFALSSKDNFLKFCVNSLSDNGSAADVFRVLLHTSVVLKERVYDRVELCFNGKTKFVLPGEDFQEIGTEFGVQNVLYTIRTFPEKLLLPNGSSAYSERHGGILYLAKAQMDDFNDMNKKWFINDLHEKWEAKINAKKPNEYYIGEEVL